MAYTRADYERSVADSVKRVGAERHRELEVAKYDGLSAAHVTGDQHWDAYLQRLQERHDVLVAGLANIDDDFHKAPELDDTTLRTQKFAAALATECLALLDWVMTLPKELMEKGDAASEALGNIDESTH